MLEVSYYNKINSFILLHFAKTTCALVFVALLLLGFGDDITKIMKLK